MLTKINIEWHHCLLCVCRVCVFVCANADVCVCQNVNKSEDLTCSQSQQSIVFTINTHAYTQRHQVAPLHKRLAEISFFDRCVSFRSVRFVEKCQTKWKKRRKKTTHRTAIRMRTSCTFAKYALVCGSYRVARSFVRLFVSFIPFAFCIQTKCEKSKETYS